MITKYGFSVGQIVTNKVSVHDENLKEVPANSKLRIVAIAPKVRLTAKYLIQGNPEIYDSKEYFLNLVPADQEKDWGNRIRIDFVCVKK